MRQCSVIALLLLAAIAAAAEPAVKLKITTRRENDRVVVRTERETAIISIHSPRGISHAVIERDAEVWPDAVIIRLHLKGLENFQLSSGELKIKGAVGMQDGKPLIRLWRDGREDLPLDVQSPFWIDIRVHDTEQIPLNDAYLELPLPKALFKFNPRSIKSAGSTSIGAERGGSVIHSLF